MVVDGDISCADYFEHVAAHDDGGVLIDADAEQLRTRFNDLDEVEMAVPELVGRLRELYNFARFNFTEEKKRA